MSDEPLALYIHWPFCFSKCPYCDFNSHVRDSVDQAAWRAALLTDMAHEAALTHGRHIGSIFFGGGTPSLMPPATVAALIDAAARHWGLAADVEITLEANPNSVEVANFAALAEAGVNRVSLGVQALDDATLAFLGRAHSAGEGERAIATAQAHFDRVSFDLITARPGQSLRQWEAELAQALAFGTGHLSLYQLTVEPGTRFETLHRKGELVLPDEDLAADLFMATRAQMAAAGLPAYEVSNHARPGEESRHNLAYWRYQDYLGIGPGAHGRRGSGEPDGTGRRGSGEPAGTGRRGSGEPAKTARRDSGEPAGTGRRGSGEPAKTARRDSGEPAGTGRRDSGEPAGTGRRDSGEPAETASLKRVATERHRKPENWLAAIAGEGHGIKAERALTPAGQATEALLMGLRLAEGVDIAALARRLALPEAVLVDRAEAEKLAQLGFVMRIGDRLQVTEKGMILLDAILPKVVAG